ncbi:MAG: cupin [Sphingobacteriales bacterium 41-5]|nr:MAG: cupin [Sphingobacteriales bacterium 41-5]
MEDFNKPFAIKNTINYAEGAIVSKTIIKKPAGTITLFAFDVGEELSEHATPYDALIQVYDGEAQITIGGTLHTVSKSQSIIMPANIPHAVKAKERFKMMLTMIKN